jgi:hypothetical protein
MKLKTPKFLTASLLGLVLTTGSAMADEVIKANLVKNDGGAAHINLSGKLRMLSQMVPAAACQAASNYGSEYALGVLDKATGEFDKIVNGLEFGDPDLDMPHPEKRRLTLAAIEKVRTAWVPLSVLSKAVSDGSVTPEQISAAQDDSLLLLEAAKALVVEEVGQYSNPSEMAAAESFLIDIAGRQRMLIQMMSKTACLSMADQAGGDLGKNLESTMTTFETTLGALQNGMPSVGIRKPPTSEIAEGLAEVSAQWAAIKPFLTEVLGNAEIDAEEAAAKFRALNDMMAQMNRVVGMYTAAV